MIDQPGDMARLPIFVVALGLLFAACTPTVTLAPEPIEIHISLDHVIRLTLDDDVRAIVEAPGNAVRARSPGTVDLRTAKRNGEIGEQADGYLGVVAAGEGALAELVARENAARRTAYGRVAQARGVPDADVAKVAAVQRLEASMVGERVRDESGVWHPVELAVRVTVRDGS